MATESDLRTAVDTAIAKVLAKIASGQTITEYNEDGLRVKRDSPAELLKALKEMRSALSADDDAPRCARVATFSGAL